MKSGLLFLIACGFLEGCTQGPPSNEERRLPQDVFDQDPSRVREAVREALRSSGFVIDEEPQEGFTTLLAQEPGFTWKLKVLLHPELGSMLVTPWLEIHRQYAFRPLRALGQNMTDAAIDDAHLEGGNGRAASHDREMVEGDLDRENSEREKRIDDIARRVNIFRASLAKSLEKDQR
jgi:hypothetical protein